MSDTGRYHDITELYRLQSRESNPSIRQTIQRTIQTIKNESGLIRSMREKLIKAHRNGDIKEVKDIHDFIKGKSEYGQNTHI